MGHAKGVEGTIRLLHSLADQQLKVANAKITAGLLYKGRLIVTGQNQYKSHPIAAEYSKNDESIYLHAEVDCLIRAQRLLDSKQLSKSTLVVVRCKYDLKRNKLYGLSKPCCGCADYISSLGIGRVIYTCDSTLKQMKYITEVRNEN